MKTPFLTCIYLFIFLRISLCQHRLVLRWKILDRVLSVLPGKGLPLSQQTLCVHIQLKIVLASCVPQHRFTSNLWPVSPLSLSRHYCFPSEKLWFRLLFSGCADLLFLPLERQAPLPAHVATFILAVPGFLTFWGCLEGWSKVSLLTVRLIYGIVSHTWVHSAAGWEMRVK